VKSNITGFCKHSLNSSEFESFLRYLHQDRDRAGEEYEEIRRRLMRFFAGRNCFPEEDLADETLDRVARRMESTEVRNPAVFIWGVARIIVLEFRRLPQTVNFQDALHGGCLNTEHEERAIINREEHQRRVRCLLKCVLELSPFDRELFLEYGSQGRAGKAHLARRFGFTAAALRTRAHRVRRKIEISVRQLHGTLNHPAVVCCHARDASASLVNTGHSAGLRLNDSDHRPLFRQYFFDIRKRQYLPYLSRLIHAEG
jgi:DNA-directed RNA polymerase specialized sigma24 family protein